MLWRMRLKKLTIRAFRSIKLEQELVVDERVTILIGANDHGKSNLLAAIRCLNDEQPINESDKHWDVSQNTPAEIRWYFTPSKEVRTALEKLTEPLTIANAETVVSLPTQDAAQPIEAGETSAAEPTLSQPAVTNFPINSDGAIVYGRDSVSNKVKVLELPISIPAAKEAEVLALRPRVELFEAPSGNVKDQVSRGELDTSDFEFMQGIFRYAGLWEQRDTIFTYNPTTSRILDQASKKLTKILNDTWKQGKDLEWKFKHTGTNGDSIVIEIQDPAVQNSYTRPSLRSSGFRTYFLLSMIIYARTQNRPADSNIFLFDEPGTYLHPAAQLDLQRSFEVIADAAQIVYTTHSLFLVSKNHPTRNRVVSKTDDGTKIDQKPFSKNWKSVRESLGILLSNNFLIADKTLLVEGPSDVVYILDAIKKLKEKGLLDVDLNDFNIADAEENYTVLAKLMLNEGRELVALLDGDEGGEKIKTQLQKACAQALTDGKLQIHLLPKDKSSEDIFADLGTLRRALRRSYDQLVVEEIRKSKKDLDIDAEVAKINPAQGETLGHVIDQNSKTWFEPKEKISKLLVSVMYEDEAASFVNDLPVDALPELTKLKALLKLRGEKSAEMGVFEEIAKAK